MEENRTSLSKGLIVLIIIGLICIGVIAYFGIKDIREQNEWAEQWKKECTTSVDRIDDSTYHINLGDGGSCFTIQKIDDSLSLSGVNIWMVTVENDSLSVVSHQKSGHHTYKFAYSDFFTGPTPNRDKIGFSMN